MRSAFYFFLFSLYFSCLRAAPELVYLCLGKDPSHSMDVQWIGSGEELQMEEEHFFPEKQPIPGSQYMLKRVRLRALQPGAEYTLTIDGASYRFKTLPEDLEKKEIRFVVGGDVYGNYEKFRKMNHTVAGLSPDFVVLGGDIAYAFSRFGKKSPAEQWKRWETFLRVWHEQMVDREGRLIPMLAVVGNHDTKGKYPELVSGKTTPSLFYLLFPFEEEFVAYQKIVIANSLALFALDSGHTHPIEGQQAKWLEKALQESEGLPYKLAAYHISSYPSHTNYKKKDAAQIRKSWAPLFERHGVQVAFEHHNHTYKRTKPMNGVIYLGDGSWGVRPRTVQKAKQRPYLEKSASVNAVFLVSLKKESCDITALDQQGQLVDNVPSIFPR